MMATAIGHHDSTPNPYATLAREQFEMQDRRGDSLERRAMAVVTSSGALVTLLFAAANFFGGGIARLPIAGTILVTESVILFGVASWLALWVNRPVDEFRRPVTTKLQETVRERWADEHQVAEQRAAELYTQLLVASAKANDVKANRLQDAITFECAAIATLGLAAAVLLFFL